MDEGDGTLWLANASKLRCRFLPKGTNEDGTVNERPPEVLFFEEEDFEDEMRETEGVIECLDGKRLTPFPKFAERMTSFSTSQS